MNKLKLLIVILASLAGLTFLGLILFYIFKPKVGGIYVDANPKSMVYINGEEVGTTPYRGMRDPGEVVIKIVPQDAAQITPYETKVSFQNGVETVVRYNFGPTDSYSNGEIISFEKIAKGETSLAIVTIPDSADVVIDNELKAFAPYKTSTIKDGDHTLVFSSQGYQDKTVKVKTHEGYKLTAIVMLGKSSGMTADTTPTPAVSTTPSATPPPTGPMILILQTPTGTLKVRKESKPGSEEIGTAKSGESYPYLDRDTGTGWYKISFQGQEGWVSPQYTKKVDVKPSSTLTPTKKVTATPAPSLTPSL